MSSTEETAWTGVINPRSLAEQIAGRLIDWRALEDPDGEAAAILGIAKRAIFDPDLRAPHFALVDVARERAEVVKDLDEPRRDNLESAGGAAELLQQLRIPAPSFRAEAHVSMLALIAASRLYRRTFDPGLFSWADVGSFFQEAAEGEDPIQGALGDCYFVAAMSAVAWAYPRTVNHQTRRTGHAQQEFVDVFDFYGERAASVEVSERIPLLIGTGAPMFAGSSEAREIWPAVMEKAYAKWRTADHDDQPDYYAIEGGSAARACVELVPSHKVESIVHAGASEAAIWSFLSAHTRNRKCVRPVVASTYSDGKDDKYTDANGIVGRHAYSVLGTETIDGTHFVVLRNPWGYAGALVDVLSGIWSCWDSSYLRGLTLNSGGVFALKLSRFRTHFQSTAAAVPK